MKKYLILALLALGACASPEPSYYTLSAVDGPVLSGPPLSVEIHRPTIPQYLDRPEMVQKSGYAIHRDDANHWGEPFDSMLARTLALDIAQRMPGSTLLAEPANADTDTAYAVDIDIQQLETNNAGQLALTAQVTIIDRRLGGTTPLAPIVLQGPSATTGAPLARALSYLAGLLADRIALQLEAQPAPHLPGNTAG